MKKILKHQKIKCWLRVKQVMHFDQEIEVTKEEYDSIVGLEFDDEFIDVEIYKPKTK